ncbi:MAG: sigma-54-dependent Fis family transcriptional regulator [Deltaproteobacteria bacterium]|nr:sigma-54-dependent Fis family transcriptional regulator [Deltaproteobacteria bacterium]
MGRVLVIDDDEAGCRLLSATLKPEGHEVVAEHDGARGLARAQQLRPEVVLLDLQLPDQSGLEVLVQLHALDANLPVVMMTAHAEVRTAVRATKLGAFDYLTKPIDHEDISRIVRRALETRELKAEVEDLRRQLGEGPGLTAQMGPSPQVAQVIEQVRAVATSSFSVLVLGETGTGKELVAQAIHRASDRRANPFVALDCGAIPELLLESELFGHEKGAFTGADKRKQGQFQVAEGGTLFLDELGNLPLALQAKLLRVLESRQLQAVGSEQSTALDVRFIAATNEDLHARAEDGRFRADLYFRLAQYTITLPALRERPADIAHLVQRFMTEASVELRRPVHEIAPDALTLLEKQPWPGNVRELRNVVRQAVLTREDLPLQALQRRPIRIEHGNELDPLTVLGDEPEDAVGIQRLAGTPRDRIEQRRWLRGRLRERPHRVREPLHRRLALQRTSHHLEPKRTADRRVRGANHKQPARKRPVACSLDGVGRQLRFDGTKSVSSTRSGANSSSPSRCCRTSTNRRRRTSSSASKPSISASWPPARSSRRSVMQV